jgi:16S rRNA (guanine1207-N2)-methyltransferase
MAETRLVTPQGEFDLIRYPPTRDPNLRAWDAADELLLAHFTESSAERAVTHVVIVNDAFGALTVAVAAGQSGGGPRVRFVSDSHLATLAMRQNMERNGIDLLAVSGPGSGTEADTVEPDVVLVKIPKVLSLLEAQLVELRELVGPDTVIVGGGMTRDIHSSTIALFEQIIGPTRTSLAKKKARLIFSTVDPELCPEAPQPTLFDLGVQGVQVVNHPGVFSAQRLDNGTRLLLDNLPSTSGGQEVIDLGCGSGALGVAVALDDPTAHITFVDESRMAVRSAEATFKGAFAERASGSFRRPTFRVADCLDGLPGDSVDLILCNPPFHQGRVQGDDVAWKMFTGAKRVLRPGGELWVVGNRHLEYFDKLKRAFGNSQVMASNPKFLVIRAVA